MEPYIVGIDVGTGSTKSVAVAYSGQVVASAQFHYPTLQKQAGYSEQEPDTIWQAFKNSVKAIVEKTGCSPAAVCLSSAMHSVIMVDEQGRPLHNMITWADTRNAVTAEEIYCSPKAESLYTTTGTPVHAMAPLTKIAWLKNHEPALFVKTHKFISIKEYIWYQLFREFKVDYSIASATGLFDIAELRWSETALEMAGIAKHQLSEPVPANYEKAIGEATAKQLSLSAHTAFYIGSSDGCMANVGSFAMEDEVAALTIGTSGAVRIAAKQPIQNFKAMIFNYRLDEQTLICGGPINNGGNIVQWLLKNLLNKEAVSDDAYEWLFDQIEKVPAGSNGLLCLPYLSGERAPVWDAKSSGMFVGVRQIHRQEHFARAAVEGICFALNEVLKNLEQSVRISQLNVSGGFIQSKIWMQLLADVTGKRICLIQTEDASAVGAAYFALKHLGHINHYLQLKPQDCHIIQPDKNRYEVYQRYFSVYQQLYPGLKKAMHDLYQLGE